MPTRMVSIQAGVRTIDLCVRVAATREHQRAGFQGATLEEIQGTILLFDFGSVQAGGPRFHMRHVLAPLDAAFIGEDGHICAILTMAPSPTERYGPVDPYRWALEARAGFFMENGIQVGARLLVPRRDLFASAAASGKLV